MSNQMGLRGVAAGLIAGMAFVLGLGPALGESRGQEAGLEGQEMSTEALVGLTERALAESRPSGRSEGQVKVVDGPVVSGGVTRLTMVTPPTSAVDSHLNQETIQLVRGVDGRSVLHISDPLSSLPPGPGPHPLGGAKVVLDHDGDVVSTERTDRLRRVVRSRSELSPPQVRPDALVAADGLRQDAATSSSSTVVAECYYGIGAPIFVIGFGHYVEAHDSITCNLPGTYIDTVHGYWYYLLQRIRVASGALEPAFGWWTTNSVLTPCVHTPGTEHPWVTRQAATAFIPGFSIDPVDEIGFWSFIECDPSALN